MRERTRRKRKTGEIAAIIVTAVLFVLLLVLTVLFLLAQRERSSSGDDFSLGEITADRTVDATEISRCLLPETICITLGDEKLGLVGAENIMRELYALVSPAVSEAFASGAPREGTEEEWRGFAEMKNSVFIRYHGELPDAVVGHFADLERGVSTPVREETGYVSELFLIPYVNGANVAEAAVRDREGRVLLYSVTMPTEILRAEDLSKFIGSFRSSFAAFSFRVEGGALQPVFSVPIVTRGVIMTQNNAVFVRDNQAELNRFLRVFGMNPDKLLSIRTEEDGELTSVGTHGALTVGETTFSYQSTSEGGIGLKDLIGYQDNVGIAGYIRACLNLCADVRALNRSYIGGDAELTLWSFRSEAGKVSLSFVYTFDNIRIADVPRALEVTFEKGLLISARVYTVTVGVSRVSRVQVPAEEWFFRWLSARGGERTDRVSLVYRADFLSDNVHAEWGARRAADG